ncbi:50S ribosomal protein L5 [Candidatus Calescamantes bacterium]|nr:50S ribosomal protein L5 [Candidatus Calescamantes bacterium]
MPNLKVKYLKEVLPRMVKDRGYKNFLQVPRLEKIVVNMGVGEAINDAKILEEAVEELGIITGQKPLVTKARKSISGFKLRKGRAIGCKVTLRGDRMYEFLERLITFALPRVRDFRGLPRDSFDGRGNYNFGVSEQYIFPEIEYDKVSHVLGMDINVVTTAKSDEEAFELLEAMGFPFEKG